MQEGDQSSRWCFPIGIREAKYWVQEKKTCS